MTDFDAAQFDIPFDHTVLTIDDISAGADINDGTIDQTTIPVAVTNELSPGTVRVVLNVPAFPGVTGAGTLADLRFHAIGADGTSSAIELSEVVLVDKTARVIPSTVEGPVTVEVGR